MSQHDFTIANQTSSASRTDLNNGLQALASLSSGASAPSTTFANMLWYDTTNKLLKMRSDADDAWISVCYLNQTSNLFNLLDDTKVVTSAGSQTGVLGGQTDAGWEAGTITTDSLISPASLATLLGKLEQRYTIRYQETSGTAATTMSAATWTTVPFNTEYLSEISGTSLDVTTNVGEFTLPAGTYDFSSLAQLKFTYNQGKTGKTRLYNVTDASTEVIGLGYGTTTYGGDALLHADYLATLGRFTLASSKVLRLEAWVSGGSGSTIGHPATAGIDEIYAQAEIIKRLV